MPELRSQALSLLRQSLNNYTANFRDDQWEAIAAIIQERSRLLVVQRTGWGKSLVYFLATRLLRDKGAGPTLLISPLLALMRNQIVAAGRIGIRAATINSSNTDEWEAVKAQLLAGQVDLLLISPERLIDKVLKILALESHSPVTKQGSKWYATPIVYQSDTKSIAHLIQIRRDEQARMRDYMQSQKCLMSFLSRELDDPNPSACGKCAACLNQSLLPQTYSQEIINQAILFLRRSDQVIEPRKQVPSNALSSCGLKGKIPDNLRAFALLFRQVNSL